MSADFSRPCLLVPMNVEALAVGAASAAIDLSVDFSALAEGGPCLGSLLGREPFQETPRALAPGVYLHWSLPDGLTHAPESAAGEDAGARMPAIPNRWLVLRFAAAGAACRGWVVESDTLTGVREGRAWPRRVVDASAPLARDELIVHLGRCVPLEAWSESHPARQPGITALGYGDPVFAASFPHGRGVLGFHDEEVCALQEAELHYLVLGWYSAPKDDDPLAACLHKALAARDWNAWKDLFEGCAWVYPGLDELLAKQDERHRAEERAQQASAHARRVAQRRRGAVPRDAVRWLAREYVEARRQAQARKAELDTAWHHLPGRILCHGLLAGLRWRGAAAAYGGPPRGAPFRAALGEHGAEAMAALLGAQPGVPAQHAAYFEALQHDLDPLLERPGGAEHLAHELHARRFQPLSRASGWEIVEREPAPLRAGRPARKAIPGIVRRALAARERQQREADALARELDSLGQALYLAWYQRGLASFDCDPEAIERWRAEESALLAKIAAQRERLAARVDAQGIPRGRPLERVRALVERLLPGYELRRVDGERFHRPRDPVLLLAGPAFADPGRHGKDGRHRADGRLHCRTSACLAQGEAAAAKDEPTIGALADAELQRRGIPAPAARLLREAIEIARADDAVAVALADATETGRASAPPASVGTPADGSESGSGSGSGSGAPGSADSVPAAIACTRWCGNPWLPLLLQWRVSWSELARAGEGAAALAGWRLGAHGDGYERSAEAVPGREHVFTGTSLMTPGVADSLQRRLCEAGVEVAAIDVLGQSLDGLMDGLLARCARPELPPLEAEGHAGPLRPAPHAAQLEAADGLSPLRDARLLPLRAGLLRIERLRVIDAFGRFMELQPEGGGALPVVLPPRLRGPGGAALFEPRLVQAARLVVDWPAPARWRGGGRNPDGAAGQAARVQEDAAAEPGEGEACAWILPDRIGGTLALLDAAGNLLGALQAMRGKADAHGVGGRTRPIDGFRWVATLGPHASTAADAPGETAFDPADPLADRGADPLVRELVRELLRWQGASGARLADLLDALQQAAGELAPDADDPAVGLLVGRPLALVRARLRLELDGLPAHDPASAQGEGRCGGVEAIAFPLRLGDFGGSGEDGLAGFFLADEPGRFHPAWGLRTGEGRPELRERSEPVLSIERPLELILLMDPERGFTVTSAVLPRAHFRPPGAGERVRARSLMFFTGPVLGACSELRLPRPSDLYGQWAWNHHPRVGVRAEREVIDTAASGSVTFPPDLALAEGWLRLEAVALAIDGFGVVDAAVAAPSAGAAQDAVAGFELPPQLPATLAWTVSGADAIELSGPDGRVLLCTAAAPLPSTWALAQPLAGRYRLRAWRWLATSDRDSPPACRIAEVELRLRRPA